MPYLRCENTASRHRLDGLHVHDQNNLMCLSATPFKDYTFSVRRQNASGELG